MREMEENYPSRNDPVFIHHRLIRGAALEAGCNAEGDSETFQHHRGLGLYDGQP
jgi:hypothetical protein